MNPLSHIARLVLLALLALASPTRLTAQGAERASTQLKDRLAALDARIHATEARLVTASFEAHPALLADLEALQAQRAALRSDLQTHAAAPIPDAPPPPDLAQLRAQLAHLDARILDLERHRRLTGFAQDTADEQSLFAEGQLPINIDARSPRAIDDEATPNAPQPVGEEAPTRDVVVIHIPPLEPTDQESPSVDRPALDTDGFGQSGDGLRFDFSSFGAPPLTPTIPTAPGPELPDLRALLDLLPPVPSLLSGLTRSESDITTALDLHDAGDAPSPAHELQALRARRRALRALLERAAP